MKVIRESAEHHFITMLEKLKENSGGWVVFTFALSRMLDHGELVGTLDEITVKIGKARATASHFCDGLEAALRGVDAGFIYHFSDNDIMALVQPSGEKDKEILLSVFKDMARQAQPGYASRGVLGEDLYGYQKLADAKLLSARRFEAYGVMADANKVSSIGVRRSRCDVSKVLIIEDDRFTASYAANILSKEYELGIARTGEDGIISYIEQAPDIVFLDIHLPGLNGHETLQAIRAVDPKAFVVMLSVDTAKNSIVQATQTGAHSFLKKPFSKERLLNTVRASPYVRGIHDDMDGSVH
ncbi:MAG: response regulator [Alphaproteobacteria bacterium]